MTYLPIKSTKCDIPYQLVKHSADYSEYLHRDTGETFYGTANTKDISFYLFKSDDDFFTPKKKCNLFRYASQATKAGGMFPIVSVNVERGLVYFWIDEAGTWATKGLKLDSLCVLE